MAEYPDLYISHGGDSSGFVGNLKTYLLDKGFKTLKDSPNEIVFHRYFIVVLSQDSCTWDRLDELVKIINTAEVKCVRVSPVFYHVDPADVRWQTGDYGQALAAHRNCVSSERFDGWIKAMKIIADKVGLHIKRDLVKDEADYFKEIYQNLSEHVVCTVGLHRRALEVMSLLNSGFDVGVRIAGICGVPGIGKSTVARRVHHCSSKEFSHHHFIDKAGEHIKNHGLRSLLSKLVGGDNFDSKFINVDQVLKQNKFLLTFEDVDDQELLLNITIELPNMLGCGSKVIITSKDYHFLQTCGIERIYMAERFNNPEAYELLSLKVCKSKEIDTGYLSILNRAAGCASGLPLLLEMIGSNMAAKAQTDCNHLLKQYENIRDVKTEEMLLVKKILQVSFDALEDRAKQKLIYIAHHLIENKSKKEVEHNLHSVFGGCSKEDMKVLLDKSLIKINENGKVILHGSTMDMIRENSLRRYISEENLEHGKQETQSVSMDGLGFNEV